MKDSVRLLCQSLLDIKGDKVDAPIGLPYYLTTNTAALCGVIILSKMEMHLTCIVSFNYPK